MRWKAALVFVFMAAMAFSYQNCGKNNPATTADADVATFGTDVEGFTFLFSKKVSSNGDVKTLAELAEDPEPKNIFFRFMTKTEITGFDGCNNYFGSIVWSPRKSTEDLDQLEFVEMSATEMACPEVKFTFMPEGSYYIHTNSEGVLSLIELDSSDLYEFPRFEDID